MSAETWPTTALSQDHQAVLAKLLELEQSTAQLSEGTGSAKAEKAVRDAVAFLQAEMPPHFDREEKLLFPPLELLSPMWKGLLAVILAEHEGLHELRANLVASVEAVGRGEADWAEVRRRADDLIVVLRRHINKEDTLIFPAAEKDLGSERLAEIAEEIHRQGL